MIKQLLSIAALSAVTVAPAFAGLTRLSTDFYAAEDAKDRTHYIEYVRKDHEGDVLVRVSVDGGPDEHYWVNCKEDRISRAGDAFNGWDYVDHRKMEGYYSDVACRM